MQLAPDRVGAETHAAQRGAPLTGLQFHLPPHLFQTTNKNQTGQEETMSAYTVSLSCSTQLYLSNREPTYA